MNEMAVNLIIRGWDKTLAETEELNDSAISLNSFTIRTIFCYIFNISKSQCVYLLSMCTLHEAITELGHF